MREGLCSSTFRDRVEGFFRRRNSLSLIHETARTDRLKGSETALPRWFASETGSIDSKNVINAHIGRIVVHQPTDGVGILSVAG